MDEFIVQVISNFPNFAGLAILTYVLFVNDRDNREERQEQSREILMLLKDCLEDSQGRVADSERISKTLDSLT